MSGLFHIGRIMERHNVALKTAQAVLQDNEIGLEAPFNVLHCPFPAEAGTYLKAHGGAADIRIMQEPLKNQEMDPFAKMPLEVFELIFTKLTVTALDAARFACRAWYTRIMASSYILAAVVDLHKVSAPKEARDDRLRELQRQLDEDADLVKHPATRDPWRMRYRLCEVDFRLPPPEGCLRNDGCLQNRITTAKFCIDGTAIGALITKPTSFSNPAAPHSLTLYQFCLSARPRYVGKIKLPNGSDYVRIRSTVVVGRSEAWNITLEAGDAVHYYRIESAKAYSINEPAYQLTLLEDERAFQKTVSANILGEVIRTTAGSIETAWVLLGCLPRIDVSRLTISLSAGS